MSKPRKHRIIESRKEQTEQGARMRAELRQLGATSSRDLRRIAADQRCDEESRIAACWLLGRINDREASATLLRVVRRESNDRLTHEAYSALGMIGNREVTPSLLQMLEKAEGARRVQIVYALWFLADRRAAPALLNILRDQSEDDDARGFAAEGLGGVRPTAEILQSLTNALSDTSVNVRMSALCALSSLCWCVSDDLRPVLTSQVIPAIERCLQDQSSCPRRRTHRKLGRNDSGELEGCLV